MDYKTNILTKTLEVNDALLPEINGLYFCSVDEDKILFDYTRYFEENDIALIDYKVFMRSNKYFIETLAKPSRKKTSELFYQNGDGHILVVSELVFLFLAYANSTLLIYFNSLLHDLMTDGVAYSNGFAYGLAAERLPSDVLAQIVTERQNESAGEQ